MMKTDFLLMNYSKLLAKVDISEIRSIYVYSNYISIIKKILFGFINKAYSLLTCRLASQIVCRSDTSLTYQVSRCRLLNNQGTCIGRAVTTSKVKMKTVVRKLMNVKACGIAFLRTEQNMLA